MNESSLSLLQDKINKKMQRLLECEDEFFNGALVRFWHFLQSDSTLRDILSHLTRCYPIAGREAATCFQGNLFHFNQLIISDDSHLAAIGYQVWKTLNDTSNHDNHKQLTDLTMKMLTWKAPDMRVGKMVGELTNGYARLKRLFFQPVCDYVIEQLDERQLLFTYLLRYKDYCECFAREEVSGMISEKLKRSKEDGKTRHPVESWLQADLYRYLHNHGVEFVIEPKLDRGNIDILASIRNPDPVLIETKVFDGEKRKASEILDGFRQIYHYIRTYNAKTGYLAVYNLHPHFVGLSLDDAINPSLHVLRHGGATVFFLTINLHMHEEGPSQHGKYKETAITKDRLITALEQSDAPSDPPPK